MNTGAAATPPEPHNPCDGPDALRKPIREALTRVVDPEVAMSIAMHAVLGSAALWSAGFALYSVRYAPMRVRPRIGGRPG